MRFNIFQELVSTEECTRRAALRASSPAGRLVPSALRCRVAFVNIVPTAQVVHVWLLSVLKSGTSGEPEYFLC